MNGWHVLLIVVAIIFLMIIVLRFLLPYLKRRGVNVEAILGQTKDMISAVDKTLDTIRPFLPASPGFVILDKILDAAAVGVGNAEQLYHVGELEGNKRKQEAETYIYGALKLAGVEITPEVQRLIDGAIESEVFNLGHGTAAPKPKNTLLENFD